MPEKAEPLLQPLFNAVYRTVDGPITWFRETIVEPNQQQYAWYHKRYRRVPTIDQCHVDDPVCQFEANAQYLRDKKVDSEILQILRNRAEYCMVYYGGKSADGESQCKHLWDAVEENAANWFCKYGDLGYGATAKDVYMKQKHRLIWERRYGPVGSNAKPKE